MNLRKMPTFYSNNKIRRPKETTQAVSIYSVIGLCCFWVLER